MKQTDKNIKRYEYTIAFGRIFFLTVGCFAFCKVDISYSMMLIPHGQQKYFKAV